MPLSDISGNEKGGCCCNPGQEKTKSITGCGNCIFAPFRTCTISGATDDGSINYSLFNGTHDFDTHAVLIELVNDGDFNTRQTCGYYTDLLAGQFNPDGGAFTYPTRGVLYWYFDPGGGNESWRLAFINDNFGLGTPNGMRPFFEWQQSPSNWNCLTSNTMTIANAFLPSPITVDPI